MSWLQRLYQTYEAASQNADIQAQDQKLMPYYHVNQNVQIVITINDRGDFVRAEVCRDDNGKVKSKYLAIPATNDSATRAGQIPPPHPLSDKVQYLAGDYFEGYAVNPKRDFYQPYIELLTSWCESQCVHPKAQAVLTYVKKGTLVKDLIDAHVLIIDPNDKSKLAYPEQASDYPDSLLSALNKNKGVFDQGAAFIAWNVIASSLDTPTQHVTETWRDDSLFAAWQQFYATLDSIDGFCYITGGTSPLASKHPNRILRSATNAKLISANDATGYTFRGRFTDATGMQAAGISAVVTEKAHAALSWLLSRQGREEAGQAIVAWSISGIEVPQPTSVAAPLDVLDASKTSDNDDDDFEEYDDDEASGTEPTFQHLNDLGYRFATHLRNTLQGYRQKLEAHDQISIITLEAATPGRMAVTYYHESMPSEYIDALQAWYTQFAWYHTYRDDDSNQQRLGIQSPTPKQIAQVAYGARLSDALKKQVVAQVLPCIVEGEARRFPRQLVELCIKRACNPLALEHWEWEQALSTACALYRGYYLRQSDNKKRSYTVALQPELTSRDYLYGRLLAVAEDIESLALYVAGEKRNTTAQRYMQQFANRPFTTWRNIELALKPYENRLKSNRGGYLAKKQQLIDEIMSAFTSDRFTDDSALSGEFLLGYHSQKMQFKLDKEHAKAEVENDSDAA